MSLQNPDKNVRKIDIHHRAHANVLVCPRPVLWMVLTPGARRIRGKSRRRENKDFNTPLNNDIYYLISSDNNNIYYIYTVYGVLTVHYR